ncbi:MAG: type II toxin-antitoxin system RelE/ParE family toxin [Pseudomonadota bacterium]
MSGKRLDYAVRARRDLEAIEKYHLEVAGDIIADRIVDAILAQAEKIAALGLMFRPGIRQGTRECVMTRYPYTLVYRIGPRRVEVARIIHQRAEYFQRGR